VKSLFRDKGKDFLNVSADQEEIKKYQQKLDEAVQEFGVRRSRSSAWLLLTRTLGDVSDACRTQPGRRPLAIDEHRQARRRDAARAVEGRDERHARSSLLPGHGSPLRLQPFLRRSSLYFRLAGTTHTSRLA
jgi:hypothetical protein